MKRYIVRIALSGVLALISATAFAQQSTSSAVTRRSNATQSKQATVSDRARQRMATETSDADLAWMKVVYRSLDLNEQVNAALYFPEQSVDGQENLFRIMMRLLAADELPAYEYLDGREVFTDEYRLKVRDMLDRFHIYYTNGKGYSEKHPVFNIEESDVPSTEVLGYYIIERWEFDRTEGRMRTRIEALCPVLHRTEEFGQEAVKYPMFWVRYSDLRPHLTSQLIFTDDDNNLPQSTYDDYFNLGLYKGEIYKTRNLRNKSMAQLYPDPDDLKHAQDSIEKRLTSFEKDIWVPSLEELGKRDSKTVAENDTVTSAPKRRTLSSSRVSARRPSKKVKQTSTSTRSTSSATRSVRNRKK
ncbi:MAG: gliding motility protein GldN [Paramuribaculum sp.]|nr:gliding motility protein GldN [Paramuribaculum sp.]MDE7451877.1 gliding motility protein GldN [Paramuribaculum sp.]